MQHPIFQRAMSVLSVFLLSGSLAIASLRVCQKCGYESVDAASLCAHCGAALPPPEAAPDEASAFTESTATSTNGGHILPGSVVEQDVQMARQHLAAGRNDIAKLLLRNALALDMITIDREAPRTEAIAELLKQCEPRNGTVRAKCPACEGSGKRIMRATLSSGKAVDLSTGGMPCPQCGGNGFVRRAGTVVDMKFSLGRTASRYRVLQQARRFVPVGEAWVPEDIAARLSLRDRVTLRRALAAPCGSCLGLGQAECSACSATGRAKCPNRKCVGGSITLQPEERLGRRLEQTTKCNTCGGTGVVPCGKCRGSGAVLCKSCNGSGERPACTRCGGEGLIVCRRCGGSGALKGVPCQACGGGRETICASCQGDGKKR